MIKPGNLTFFITLSVMLALTAAIFSLPAQAAVEYRVSPLIQLDDTPLDIKTSQNGKWIFILAKNGDLLIYSTQGGLEDKVNVGPDISGLSVGPWPDKVFLISQKTSSIKLLSLSFIQTFDLSGSPTLGPAEAEVTLVVFDDFQ